MVRIDMFKVIHSIDIQITHNNRAYFVYKYLHQRLSLFGGKLWLI